MSEEHSEAHIDSMLQAAMGGMTPQELLAADQSDPEKRAAEIAKNRARALELLAVLEKNLA